MELMKLSVMAHYRIIYTDTHPIHWLPIGYTRLAPFVAI